MVKESPDDSVLDEDVISQAVTEMDISRQKGEDIIDKKYLAGGLYPAKT